MSRLDEIKARHHIDPKYEGPGCAFCWAEWPCDAAWLLERVERLREGVEGLVVIAATSPILEATTTVVRVSEAARMVLGMGGETPHLTPDERAALEADDEPNRCLASVVQSGMFTGGKP